MSDDRAGSSRVADQDGLLDSECLGDMRNDGNSELLVVKACVEICRRFGDESQYP